MLELKHITVKFASDSSVLAVDDVSMRLEDGSRTAIVGETGSGKSVLLLAILRLLPPNAVVGGQVLVDGEDVLQADKKRLRQIRGGIISYVPQGGGGSMNPLLKVGFQVGEPLMEHRGYTKQQAVAASIPLLKRFNLGREEELYSRRLYASDLNLISQPTLEEPRRLKARVRYRQQEQWAVAVQTDADRLQIEFDEPQRAVTRGQAVVLYDGDVVVGGGTIQ